MMQPVIICEVFEGLCNRINGIASALATGRPVHLRWAVNRHCPIRFDEVFLDSLGMEVLDEDVEAYAYSRTPERLCWFYPQNVDRLPFDVFQQRICEAYRRLLEGMHAQSWQKPPTPALGIAYRHHLEDSDTLEHFWGCVEEAVQRLRPSGVHVASDSAESKQELLSRLESLGLAASVNDGPLLIDDLDRSPANILGMCADLRSLAGCKLGVISNSARSTTADSARGFGVCPYYTMDDGYHRHYGCDHLYVASPTEGLAASLAGKDVQIDPGNSVTTLDATVRSHSTAQESPNLSLCMIVRDSTNTLAACLRSIAPWVDELVVVDTGSVDQTPEIARRYGARLFSFPWCDNFAAARNESLRHATGDWILWMDADDTINEENGRRLRELLGRPIDENTLGFVMQVHCPGGSSRDVTVVDHVKLLRNRPDLRFEGRIHEQVLPSIRRAGGTIEWTDIHVVHSGADRSAAGRQRKIERDLRLLQLDLQDRPEHPFVLFNLGMTLADAGEHDQAVHCLSRGIMVAHPQESHIRKAYALLVSSLTELGRLDAAYEVCRKGQQLFPEDQELAFRHGLVTHRQGRLDEATEAYQAALRPPQERHFASVDPSVGGFKARHNLALVYQELQEYTLAEQQWRIVTEEVPDFLPGWRGLGEVLLQQNKRFEVRRLAEQLLAEKQSRVEGLLLEAELAGHEGSRETQCQLLHRAQQESPDDESAIEAYCRFVFEHGTLAEAEAALLRLVNARPADAAVLHNLGVVYLRMSHYRAAIDRFRESLQLRPFSAQTQYFLEQSLAALDRRDSANPAT